MKKTLLLFIVFGFFLFTHLLIAQTWTASKRLTWTSGSSSSSEIAIDSNDNIHVVWSDETPGNDEIFYKMSTNGGMTWSGAKRLTWNAEGSAFPDIAVDTSDNIHVVWQDSVKGKYEIFHKRSTNGGISWTTKRLTWSPGSSYWPGIAIDSSDQIHIVWVDYTPGNWEVYYKKGIQ
jgi:hypothetical protein